ncbi:MAG TPA: hypothetical protein PKX40_20265 [Spirochaetota bacterium]|nr:hypothetical protein [Spirochaetota bacterium]
MLRDNTRDQSKPKTCSRSPQSWKKIIGLTPEECLERARSMFREMDLQWDLEQMKNCCMK